MLSSVFTQITAPLFPPDSVFIFDNFSNLFAAFFLRRFFKKMRFSLSRLKNSPGSINLRTVAAVAVAAAASNREARVTQEVFQL